MAVVAMFFKNQSNGESKMSKLTTFEKQTLVRTLVNGEAVTDTVKKRKYSQLEGLKESGFIDMHLIQKIESSEKNVPDLYVVSYCKSAYVQEVLKDDADDDQSGDSGDSGDSEASQKGSEETGKADSQKTQGKRQSKEKAA
jgi:hypothetical protein